MWLFFALASRILWSCGGAVDQILSRTYRQHRVLCMLIMQLCAFAPMSLVAAQLASPDPVAPQLILWVGGALAGYVLGLLPYYKGLHGEEIHNVIPFFEFTPVFLTLLALVFRDEYLSGTQMFAIALIIACGFAFSWDFKHGKVKKRLLVLMSISAFIFALQQFCIKSASGYGDAWTVAFYYTSGQALMGVTMMLALKPVRREIVAACRQTRGKTIVLSLGGSVMSFLAFASLTHAFKIAPSTGHVAALSGTQPFLSFMLAWVLGHFLSHHYEKFVVNRELKMKLFLVLGLFLGVYLLTKAP